MGGNVAAGYDECYGQDYQYDAAYQAKCQGFSENGHSEDYSRHGFQCSEDGGGGGTYILNGLGGAEEGYGSWENG